MLNHTPKFIAIIPARGGSKTIPKKNIISLNNKPLIYYTIQAAKDCSLIERCYVSTDCEEIAKVALNFGAEVIKRPDSISGDFALSEDVVNHVINQTNINKESYIVLLQPTSPLRTEKHLTECIQKFLKSKRKSAISICLAEHHPYKMLQINGDIIEPLQQELFKPRQLLPEYYRINGAIYITSVKDFLVTKKLFNPPVMGYVMPQEVSIDIDTYLDLMLTEILFKQKVVTD